SLRPPLPPQKIHSTVRRAFDDMAGTLRSLGHEVSEHRVAYGQIGPLFLPRWLRGIADDAATAPHGDLLERRTQGLARAGRKVSDGMVARARRGELRRARQINAIFDDADVVMTPMFPQTPNRVAKYEGKGALVTTLGATSVAAYTTTWNVTGQPAAAVPA